MSDQKTFAQKRFTLKGRIFYPNLFTPKKKQTGREVFDCMFAFTKEENAQVLAEINTHLGAGVQAFHTGIPHHILVNPLKHYDTYVSQAGKKAADFLKGYYWVNLSTGKDYPPQMIKQNMQPLTALDAAEVYSGRNAAVSMSFYIMMPQAGVPGSKRGFGTNFNALMLLEGGKAEGGSSVDVEQVFGQFKSDMGISANANPFANMGAPTPNAQPTQNTAPSNQQWPPANNGGGNGFI